MLIPLLLLAGLAAAQEPQDYAISDPAGDISHSATPAFQFGDPGVDITEFRLTSDARAVNVSISMRDLGFSLPGVPRYEHAVSIMYGTDDYDDVFVIAEREGMRPWTTQMICFGGRLGGCWEHLAPPLIDLDNDTIEFSIPRELISGPMTAIRVDTSTRWIRWLGFEPTVQMGDRAPNSGYAPSYNP